MSDKQTGWIASSPDHLPLGLLAYQKIASSDHQFQPGYLYSFNDIGRLSGLTGVGVRYRAMMDGWPLVTVWVEQHRERRPRYVDGAFLSGIQQTVSV